MAETTILYAEDDPLTRENYAFVLERYFDRVETAGDGEEALALYRELKPDAMLLDITMPRLDGLELLRIIRSEGSEIPVAILSAYSDQEKLLQAIPLGLTRYMIKPVKEEIFREVIEVLLSRLATGRILNLPEGLVWDLHHSELRFHELSVKLSPKERALLEMLSRPAGHFVSQQRLLDSLWPDDPFDAALVNRLAQLIYRLHSKLAELTGRKTLIVENSYAHGYRLKLH